MHHESWKVLLACAIGVGIGSLVALEMHPMLWWVGLIAGFATGYLSYEWRAVLRAVPEAWRAARGWTLPPRYFDRVVWSLALWLNTLIMSTVVTGTLLLCVDDRMDILTVLVMAQTCILFGSCVGGFLSVAYHMDAYRNTLSADQSVRSLKQAAIFMFPPVILFFLPLCGIWWCVRRIPTGVRIVAHGAMALARFLRAFVWNLFLRIHSEMRLLCGVDAMLGTIVGYCSGSALVGAVIGGTFGVVNYAVVTKRWLEPHGYLPIRP